MVEPLPQPRLVQTVVSPRAGGLSVRLNLNPDARCNFDCVYCEVDRRLPIPAAQLDIPAMMKELEWVLDVIAAGEAARLPGLADAPSEYLHLGHVALSGDGEPTLCEEFVEVVEAVLHLRALGRHGFFKIALVTNATNLDAPKVRYGIRLLTVRDEAWVKLDAGTGEYYQHVNRSDVRFERVLNNILDLGRERPIVIQSLFPKIPGQPMPPAELPAYIRRLKDLKSAGAKIQLVQIHSVSRPSMNGNCEHASLRELSSIARQVRAETGLKVEVF